MLKVTVGARFAPYWIRVAALLPVVAWGFVQPDTIMRWLCVVALVVGAVFPDTFLTWVGICVGAINVLFGEPTIISTMVAVFAVHLLTVITSLALVLPWRGVMTVRAIAPTLRKFAIVQVVAQPLAVGAALLGGQRIGDGLPWMTLVAGLVIVALACGLTLDSEAKLRVQRNQSEA